MKVKNIGVDLVEIKRFRKMPYKSNQSFYQKIFTAKEIKYCLSKADPYQHFAARFAAKEAVLKTLNQSVYRAKNIEIINDKDGAPVVKTGSRKKILISLSHSDEYAIAFALCQEVKTRP